MRCQKYYSRLGLLDDNSDVVNQKHDCNGVLSNAKAALGIYLKELTGQWTVASV